jgi:hypothetical protein
MLLLLLVLLPLLVRRLVLLPLVPPLHSQFHFCPKQ